MQRLSLFVLLAVLAGVPTIAICQQAQAAEQNGEVRISWTKAQVKQALGKPDRTTSNGNIWYYGQRAIQFTNGKVSGFGGAAG